MSYNYEGDIILSGNVIDNKRFVLKNSGKAIETDIREWISFEGNNVLRGILEKLEREKHLPKSRKPGDFDARAMIIWDFVARTIKYAADLHLTGKKEFWMFPPEVCRLKKGDCEDSSFLLASLLIASGISPFCVRVVFGDVQATEGGTPRPHSWVAYKNEIGKWCILESTIERVPTILPYATRYENGQMNLAYRPRYCFNNYHLWEIYSPDQQQSSDIELKHYIEYRPNRLDVSSPELAPGGWLSHETGHLDITEKVLKGLGFSADAVDIAGDASQNPDFYEWDAMGAHAQTAEDANGVPEAGGKATYLQWVKEKTGLLLHYAKTGDIGRCVYMLGYVLHGIQDLPSHKGLTNSQHSYLCYRKHKSPDSDKRGIAKAADYTVQYINILQKRISAIGKAVIFEEMKIYKGKNYSKSEKAEIVKVPEWQFPSFIGELIKYQNLWKIYKDKKESEINFINWNDAEVFNDLKLQMNDLS